MKKKKNVKEKISKVGMLLIMLKVRMPLITTLGDQMNYLPRLSCALLDSRNLKCF